MSDSTHITDDWVLKSYAMYANMGLRAQVTFILGGTIFAGTITSEVEFLRAHEKHLLSGDIPSYARQSITKVYEAVVHHSENPKGDSDYIFFYVKDWLVVSQTNSSNLYMGSILRVKIDAVEGFTLGIPK